MKSILIVDEDSSSLLKIAEDLRSDNYIVVFAKTGLEAKEQLLTTPFTAVISEVEVSELNGIELLEWAKSNINTFFILTSSKSHEINTQTATELGADAFISKPLDINEIRTLMMQITYFPHSRSDEKEDTPFARNYALMDIDEVIAKFHLKFDIYLKLKDQSYIQIAEKDSAPPRDKLFQYRLKGIRFVYYPRDQFFAASEVTSPHSLKLQNDLSPNIARTVTDLMRADCIQHIEAIHYNFGFDFISTALEFLFSNSQYKNYFANCYKDDEKNQKLKKNILKALFAILIARKLEMNSTPLYFKMFLAAMLDKHDTAIDLPSDVHQIRDQAHLGLTLSRAEHDKKQASWHPLTRVLLTSSRSADWLNLPKISANPIEILNQNAQSPLVAIDEPSMKALKSLFRTVAAH